MFNSKKAAIFIAGAVILTGVGATSAMAQGKCGAANTMIQRNLKTIEAKMNHLEKLKKEVIKADNMKCGAAKEEAARRIHVR